MRVSMIAGLVLALAPLSAWADFLDNKSTEDKVTAALRQEGIGGVDVDILQLRGGSMNMFLQGYQAMLEGSAAPSQKSKIDQVVHGVLDPLMAANNLSADRLEVNDSHVTYR